MADIKEKSTTNNLQPTHKPEVGHHEDNDTFCDVTKGSMTESFPMSNAVARQQRNLQSFPSSSTFKLSTGSNVTEMTNNAENVLSFRSPPVPVLHVEKTAVTETSTGRSEQVKSNNAEETYPLKTNQRNHLPETKTDVEGQSPVDYSVMETVGDVTDRKYMNVKPLICDTSLSSEAPNADSCSKDPGTCISSQQQRMLSSQIETGCDDNFEAQMRDHVNNMSRKRSFVESNRFEEESCTPYASVYCGAINGKAAGDTERGLHDYLGLRQRKALKQSHVSKEGESVQSLQSSQNARDTSVNWYSKKVNQAEEFLTCIECGEISSPENGCDYNMEMGSVGKVFKCKDCCGSSDSTAISSKCHEETPNLQPPITDGGKLGESVFFQDQSGTCAEDKNPFRCGECGKTYKQSHSLYNHMRIHTGEKPYKCSECGKAYRRSDNLCYHMRTHSGEKPFECSHCGKTFKRNSEMNQHMKVHSQEKPFECSQCGNAFGRKSDLHQHLRKHTGEKPLTCSECGVTFRYSGSLHNHMKIHTDAKPFECSECGETFRMSSRLLKHMRMHSGEKSYKCNECGETFVQSSSLHRHIRLHTGDKPFKCYECGKAFVCNSALTYHSLRAHADKTPVQCSECAETFSSRSLLVDHMKTHQSKKEFKCDKCGKEFKKNSHLLRHVRTHTGEKPFKCTTCGKGYAQSVNLQRHMESHAQ